MLAVFLVSHLLAVEHAVAQAGGEYASVLTKAGSIKPRSVRPAFAVPQGAPAKKTDAHLPAKEEKQVPELANRRQLEEQAGRDAGKLLIRSAPSEADVWIEELAVGKTPLLLVLHPGTYTAKVRALGTNFVEQRVEIMPGNNHEVVFSLPLRYPAQIRLR